MQFSFDYFSLHLKCEDGNENDKYTVAVMIGG